MWSGVSGAKARNIRRMTTIQEIVDSLDTRIRELNEEIATLTSARVELRGNGRRPSPRRTSRRRSGSGTRRNPRTASASDGYAPTEVSQNQASPSRGSARKPRRARASQPSQSVSADRLEALLSENGGLSTGALAEQTTAPRDRVLGLLRELEAAGRIRRTGQRRGTRWHAITDEDRIRERAAELEARRTRKP